MEALLTHSITAIITVFATCFVLDLLATIKKAWDASQASTILSVIDAIATLPEPSLEIDAICASQQRFAIATLPEPLPEPQPKPQPTFATLAWVQLPESEPKCEEVDIVTLAKSRQTPQVPEIKFTIRERLEVMTVKRLRQLASAKKIKNYGNLNKNDLIAVLAG